MALLNRYTRLGIDFPALGDSDRFLLEQDVTGVWLHDRRPPDSWPGITESVFTYMARGVRRVAASDVLRAVHVTPPEPSHRAAYDLIFRVPIHFGSPYNALLMDYSYIETMLRPAPMHVTRILTAHADAHLASQDGQRTTRGNVDLSVWSLLATRRVSITRVGQMLAMSRQTLYRRLKEEGTTFEAVLEGVRLAMAIELLAQPQLSVRDVARRTGFAQSEAFSRAFKRWTGHSPRAARDGTLPATRTSVTRH